MSESTAPLASVDLPEVVTVPLAQIRPYWRNPRRIPPEAVAAVRSSIERYGYAQPIVVDSDLVIVVGHTRYAALVEMGVEQVAVYVTDLPPDKVKEYRLVDNRTSEMTDWDHGALVVELREMELALIEQYFPDVKDEVTSITEALATEEDVARATQDVLTTLVREPAPVPMTTVVCPACFHQFEVRTATLPGLSQEDLEEMDG